MNMRDRATLLELAALLEVSGFWAWRLSKRMRSLRRTGGVMTVSLSEAMRLKRRRDADPPNQRGRGGRPTYVQAMKNRISSLRRGVLLATESAPEPAGQHPALGGTKTTGAGRPPSRGR